MKRVCLFALAFTPLILAGALLVIPDSGAVRGRSSDVASRGRNSQMAPNPPSLGDSSGGKGGGNDGGGGFGGVAGDSSRKSVSTVGSIGATQALASSGPGIQSPMVSVSWPLADGSQVSGSYFVTKDVVHVLDWDKGAQYAIPRKDLPQQQSDLARDFRAELDEVVEPCDVAGKVSGTDFVVGTYHGMPPFDLPEMATVTTVAGPFVRVQYSFKGRLCKVEHANRSNNKDGVQVKLYPSGEVCQLYFFSNGTMAGPYLRLYPDGTFLNASIKVDGKSDGVEYTFHSNGNLAIAQAMRAGKRHGQTKHFDLDGQLFGVEDFEDDQSVRSRIVREIATEAEMQRITACSTQLAAVSRFAELWGR